MDRFTQLAAFVRTVDRGSQAAAARELGVTAAMVGRYIRGLEDRLGTRLLNRTTTTQSLTEAGAAFHARATAVLEQLETAENAVAEREAEPRGVLRVSAPMSFGVRYLASAVAVFGAAHPGLRVELTMNDRVVDLVDEGYDLALRIGQLRDSGLIARRLAPCRIAVCASPAYLDSRGAPATPAELGQHDCVLYAYASGGAVWRFVAEGGTEAIVEVAGTFLANNGDAVLAAAIEGAGVLMQPTFIVGDALRDGSLVRILPGWRVPDLTIHAVYPSARHLSPKVRRFVDFLAGRFGGEPLWDAGL